MGEKGIPEKILLDTVARFENAESGNTAAAKLLREGIAAKARCQTYTFDKTGLR